MSHICQACVVTCEDFRLHARRDGANVIGQYIQDLGVDCDLITRAGAVQDLVRPRPGFDSALLRDLTVSVHVHHVKTIHLVNHQDCGAYAEFSFPSRDAEIKQHRTDLTKARSVLQQRFPGVEIVLAFAELQPGSRDQFTIARVA